MVNLDVAPGFTGAAAGGVRRDRPFTGAFPAALVTDQQRRAAAGRRLARRAANGACAAATASASTTAPTPRSRGSWSLSRRLPSTDTSSARSTTPLTWKTRSLAPPVDDHQQLRRRQGLSARRDADLEPRRPARRSARGWQPAPAIPARAARTSTSCARPTAGPTGSHRGRRSRSSGSRRRASRSCTSVHAAAAQPADPRRRRQRRLHPRQVDRQCVVHRRRRPGGRAERSGPRRRARPLELRPAPPVRLEPLVELPFGANRRWLNQGRPWAAVSATGRWRRRSPRSRARRSPRGCSPPRRDVARGTNGTLRADYTGGDVTLETRPRCCVSSTPAHSRCRSPVRSARPAATPSSARADAARRNARPRRPPHGHAGAVAAPRGHATCSTACASAPSTRR